MKSYLILFKHSVDKSLLSNCKILREFKNLPKIIVVEATESVIDELKNENSIVSISEDSSDEFDEMNLADTQQESYGLEMLQAHEFWKRGYRGQGVKIAVLDGGCQAHEDLNIAGGFNAYDPSQTYMSDYRDHGTHCVGIINMQDNDKGWVGIAPEAEMYVVKMDDNIGGGNGISAQVAGVNWCIENNIDIISMSISGNSDNAARREAFRAAAEDHGIICVTSASNEQRGVPVDIPTIRYPAKYEFVVGVGNINSNKQRSPNSSVGNGLDISGPGVSIMSTLPDSDNEVSVRYGTKSGTSMSTPYIAGLFALYKQMFPSLNREELILKMKKNAEPLGDSWQYGVGLAQFPSDNQKNIQMKKREGGLWANLLPVTLAHNIFSNEGDSLQSLLDNKLNATIESNDQGTCVRFANGLQVCVSAPFEQTTTEEYNGDYRSELVRWEFALPFFDGSFYGSASARVADKWAGRTSGGDGTNMAIRQYGYNASSSPSTTTAFAIGFWKEVA